MRIGLSATPFKHGETDKVHKFLVKGFFGPLFKTTTTETGVIKTADLQKRTFVKVLMCVSYYQRTRITQRIIPRRYRKGIVSNHEFHQKYMTYVQQYKEEH